MKTSVISANSKTTVAICLAAAALLLPLSTRAGFAPYPFSDGFETVLNYDYWTLQGAWGPSWETARSGTSCLTDSPWLTYGANQDSSATLGVDLRFNAVRPMLTFWQRYAFEPDTDYGFVEVSRDQGASWTRLSAVTGGSPVNWSRVQLDLTAYAGAQVFIRFRLLSNASYQYDGWYIDDLQINENTAPSVFPFYDSMDLAASPNNWMASVWQQVVGSATNSGLGMSWRADLGNNSQPGGDLNCPLTLNPILNLAGTVNPKLSFWWRAGSQENNTLYAQASTDAGKTWGTIWSWNSWSWKSQAWTRQQVDLNAYIGYTNLSLRFLAYNPSGRAFNLDFQLDEVLIDEAPTDVALSVGPGTDPRHNALLTWTASTAPDFAYYALYRSTTPNVGPDNFTSLTLLSNRSTVSFMDTNGLDVIGQTYYYRVLVWDTQGLHNWGAGDVSYRTTLGQMATSYPFTEGFESGNAYWSWDRPWTISTQMAHSGTYCLASNPGANYANNADVSAYLTLDLATANRPMLSFWQHYGFEPNQDYGFVEISLNQGASWSRLYAVTSQSGAGWSKVQVPLDGYAGAQVVIRFRLRSDAQNAYDGWFIDDVQVSDFGAVALGYPFADGMDTVASQTNWIPSDWQPSPSSVQTNGTDMSWRCLIGNNFQPGGDLSCPLTLAGTVDMTGAVNPQLWFWWRAGGQENNTLYAQTSTDAGKTWGTIWSWNSWSGKSQAWTRQQVDLTPYIGYTNLSLRFLTYNPSGRAFNLDFQVDDVLIAEQPAPPPNVTASVGPGPDPRHNALVTWAASSAPSFASYSIYRSTSTGVSVNSLLVAALTNRTTTSFVDTNLSVVGQTYYYRVIVWDTNGLHNTGTGDLPYTTRFGQMAVSWPFAEDFEGSVTNWAFDWPWASTTVMAHTGTYCLGSNPGADYANNADVSAYLNLDLTGATRPLLSFWQRYGFEPDQDYGFVEASLNQGASWTRLYAVTGQSGAVWQNVQLDLGAYAGSQVLIRFRLKSDGQNPYSGWYIDDVALRDFGQASLGYPFHDSMDANASLSNWVASAWQQVPGSATNSSGMSWRVDMGNNSQPGGDLYSALTLAGTLNLAPAVHPKLSFWWRAGGQENNTLSAQVSTDAGKTWNTLWSWNSWSWNSVVWTRQQVDMEPYSGYTNLTLRFLAYNPSGRAFNLDFQVDEVLVDEAPTDTVLTIGPGPDPRHSALLSWTASTAPDFGGYAIYRSTSSGVSPSSLLVATITNRSTTSFLDTNLDMINWTYYYRVLVWDSTGLHNWGTGDVSYRTSFGQMVTALPFTEAFESGDASWAMDRPWALTTEMSHSGAYCLASNPGNSYANNADLSAYLRVDLTTAVRPVLSFWQQYGFEPNQDFGFVEVSLNQGASWTRLYAVTSQSGAIWSQAQVPLDSYAGSQVWIRFRVKSDAQNPYSGWYIDDVQINDYGALAFSYPFYDSMDPTESATNWVGANWQHVPGSATSGGGRSWRCLIGNNFQPGGDLSCPLTLAGTVDMTGAVNPQLWFWWRAGGQENNTLYAQVSTDAGKTWGTIWSWNSWSGKSQAWTRQQVDLSSYIGYANLSLRFLAYNPSGRAFNLDFQVDEVLIAPGGGIPTILTCSPLPAATAGYGYSLILQATNGSQPYSWAVVSNTLPPGLTLNSSAGIISGIPTNAGTFNFWLSVTTSNSLSWQKPFSLAVLDYLPIFPSQSTRAFISPGTNVVYCQVDNQTSRRLLSLVWMPTLPAGWTIVQVEGDGSPALGPDGKILFQAQYLSNSPLRFNYAVRVPAGVTEAQPIGGQATILLDNMVNERTLSAVPNPLFSVPRLYHSADYETNYWVIDTAEASRVLSYWRAQAYHLDSTTPDGYAQGPGDQVGALHSADWEPPFWQLDGTEVNRVLAYWRAGCYQQATGTPDGFAEGCAPPGPPANPVATQQVPLGYQAGGNLLVTNQLTYSGTLLSLLWRPQLPPGWTLGLVLADGEPELVNGELVWTRTNLPPSPVQVLYLVNVPASQQGPVQIRNQIEYQTTSMLNPASLYATPDPLILNRLFLAFTDLKRQPNGTVQLSLSGLTTEPVRVQASANVSPPVWDTLTTLPALSGSVQYLDELATNQVNRFYRLVSP